VCAGSAHGPEARKGQNANSRLTSGVQARERRSLPRRPLTTERQEMTTYEAGEIRLPRKRSNISADFRAPLWRGRWPASPQKLRRRFELYVDEFERYIEERRAA
jgi:hypothetical protein